MEDMGLNIEERIVHLSVVLEKLQYLVSSINQKFEKCTDAMNRQEKEAFIYERDEIRIHLDIVDDYIHEVSGIVHELLADLRND